MAVNRVSSYNVYQSTLRNSAFVQNQLFDLQTQLSSGQKTQSFDGISEHAEQFLLLEAKVARADTFQAANQTTSTRLEQTGNALENIIEIATDLKNIILLRRNGTQSDNNTFQELIRGKWQSLVEQLNSNVDGRYVFSGTSIDTRPVESTNFPTLFESGVPDTGYYHGNSEDITTHSDETTSFISNVRANEDAFQKLFAGLAMAKTGNDQNDSNDLEQAYDFVNEGIAGVVTLSASVNANKVALQQTNDRLVAVKLYWRGLKEELVNTDMVAASTQVAINQGILQAAFQAFARINNLRLSNYLS